jgi:hypothetical protein
MAAGLPDGLFSKQKSKYGKFLEGLALEDVVIFCGHLVYFSTIWYNIWIFGTFCGNLAYISRFGMLYQENLATLHGGTLVEPPMQ